MVFYLEPPRGRTSLARLEKFAKARLHFLLKVSRCHGNSIDMQDIVMDTESVAAADCLIEGCTKDATSHFILRLACACNPAMSDFFVQSERNFFNYRVSCMTEKELLSYVVNPLQKLHRHLLTNKHLSLTFTEILDILQHMTERCDLETLVKLFVEGEKGASFTLPFVYVLRLVAARSAVLRRGIAVVPCNKICHVLETIFMKLIIHGMKDAKLQAEKIKLKDSRLKALFLQLERIFCQHYDSSAVHVSPLGVLSAEVVDRYVDIFPLCMTNLHHRLRNQHRLKHHDRIQYTLYLKEMGMPVHEALQFWRNEYSQPAHADSCAHSWTKEARRYTYNIRHLYGLEGARVNYRGHCCSALQKRVLSPLEVGGCPFSNCDQTSLRSILDGEQISVETQHEILAVAGEGKAKTACQVFQWEKIRQQLIADEGLSQPNKKEYTEKNQFISQFINVKKEGVKNHVCKTVPEHLEFTHRTCKGICAQDTKLSPDVFRNTCKVCTNDQDRNHNLDDKFDGEAVNITKYCSPLARKRHSQLAQTQIDKRRKLTKYDTDPKEGYPCQDQMIPTKADSKCDGYPVEDLGLTYLIEKEDKSDCSQCFNTEKGFAERQDGLIKVFPKQVKIEPTSCCQNGPRSSQIKYEKFTNGCNQSDTESKVGRNTVKPQGKCETWRESNQGRNSCARKVETEVKHEHFDMILSESVNTETGLTTSISEHSRNITRRKTNEIENNSFLKPSEYSFSFMALLNGLKKLQPL